MIWLIGGTTDAKKFIKRLNYPFIMSVAGVSKLAMVDGVNMAVGRLNLDDMVKFIQDKKIKLVLNFAHPYATEVSKNSKEAAALTNIPYCRYLRPPTKSEKFIIVAKDVDDAVKIIKQEKGTVFFTTGSKNIADFEKIRGKRRFVYRVLPAIKSLELCEEAGVKATDILASTGPFSTEFNMACFKNYKAKLVVTKNSGTVGGTKEKVEACKKLGTKLLMIQRAQEEGFGSFKEIEEFIHDIYAGHRS